MRKDLEMSYGWLKLFNIDKIQKTNPLLHSLLRECAYWRHAALVYGTMGVNERANRELYEHMKVVDDVYGKVPR